MKQSLTLILILIFVVVTQTPSLADPLPESKTVESICNDPQCFIISGFVPGLGQILMGDFWRGFKFTLATVIVPGLLYILLFTLQAIINTNQPQFSPIRELNPASFLIVIVTEYLLVLGIPIYFWNLLDAMNMSKQLFKEPEIEISLAID